MTFSIIAWDPETKMTGIAVSTANLAVGAVGYNIQAGVGSIATQADPHPILGQKGLRLLEEGISVEDTLELLLKNDKKKHHRQIQIVDRFGNTAAWTGDNCVDWAGHHTDLNFSVAGNILVGQETIHSMARVYKENACYALPERLICALEAGQTAGGDKRGRQSAALYVVRSESYADVDLRVDDHDNPVVELRRIFEESKKPYYVAFRRIMPTKRNPDGMYDDKVTT